MRGGVRVEVLTDQPAERFAAGAVLHPEGRAEPLTIVEAWPADPGWVLRFREVPTRDAAEALRNVYLERDAPPDALPRGTYYWHELVGAPVTDLEGGALGVVRDVYRSGGAEILIVTGGPRGDFDVPVARPFVRILAPRRGEVVVDAALLDLPEPGSLLPPRPPRPPRPVRARRTRPGPGTVGGVPGTAGGPATPGTPGSIANPDVATSSAPAGAENGPAAGDGPAGQPTGEPTSAAAPPSG